MDTDFPFGANLDAYSNRDPSDYTFVIDTGNLKWADIEAERRAARADVATVANSNWASALRFVSRIRHPALRAWAGRWLEFCLNPGTARPVRHVGEAGKACRRVEIRFAELGIIDPNGFEERERAQRGRSASRDARRRQKRGGDCGGLREYNERMRGPWIG